MDLAKRIQRETEDLSNGATNSIPAYQTKKSDKHQSQSSGTNIGNHNHDNSQNIGKMNALLLAGDFNCELQSSACSTYLRIGRLGRQAGLGGIHGEDSLAIPPSLLETSEACEILHPIMEWGRALPNDRVADVAPHPFRRNGMTSAYPVWLGKEDAREHFTFCGEKNKRPVPGLDQIWFSGVTLERMALRRMFVDDLGEWKKDDNNDDGAMDFIERRRDEERKRVLKTGLPDPECKHPSDHLPIGCMFDWKWDTSDDACFVDDINSNESSGSSSCNDKEVRSLKVVDAEGNIVKQVNSISKDATGMLNLSNQQQMQHQTFETPYDELEYLLQNCPYDSEQQKCDVHYILSPIEPPLCTINNTPPTVEQLHEINARRDKKSDVLATSSLGVRSWLKKIWKANKQVGAWERNEDRKKLMVIKETQ